MSSFLGQRGQHPTWYLINLSPILYVWPSPTLTFSPHPAAHHITVIISRNSLWKRWESNPPHGPCKGLSPALEHAPPLYSVAWSWGESNPLLCPAEALCWPLSLQPQYSVGGPPGNRTLIFGLRVRSSTVELEAHGSGGRIRTPTTWFRAKRAAVALPRNVGVRPASSNRPKAARSQYSPVRCVYPSAGHLLRSVVCSGNHIGRARSST